MAFDRAEFDELLREVVALREWKAMHEAAAFGARCINCKGGDDSFSSANPILIICRNCWIDATTWKCSGCGFETRDADQLAKHLYKQHLPGNRNERRR